MGRRGPSRRPSERGLRAALQVLPGGRADRLRAHLAPAPALLAVALDLAAQLLLAEVDRVPRIPRLVARAERHALERQRRLGDHVVADRLVALLLDLHLAAGPFGHLV